MLARIQDLLGLMSGLVLLYAFLPYWQSIKSGSGHPKKATWLVWFVGDLIGLIGQIADRTMSIIIAGAVFCGARTLAMSLQHGEPGWSLTDRVSLALSGLALVMWVVMHLVHAPHAPDYAIAFSMLALIIGGWPTWVSAWRKPQNEDAKSWVIFCTSSFIALFAIKHLAFADIVVPATFMFIDGITLAIILTRTYEHEQAQVQAWTEED